jgi:hypothetical protein
MYLCKLRVEDKVDQHYFNHSLILYEESEQNIRILFRCKKYPSYGMSFVSETQVYDTVQTGLLSFTTT